MLKFARFSTALPSLSSVMGRFAHVRCTLPWLIHVRYLCSQTCACARRWSPHTQVFILIFGKFEWAPLPINCGQSGGKRSAQT